MSDYRVDVKVRNNNILKRIEEHGYKTISEFCSAYGMDKWNAAIGEFINLKKIPINSKGLLHPAIEWMCDMFFCTPDDLFTGVKMTTEMEDNKRSLIVSEAELQFTLGYQKETLFLEDQIHKMRLPDKVKELIDTLTPREAKVINMRFGLDGNKASTLEETASTFEVTRERIRQIEIKALRKLRHASRANLLADYREE